LTAAAQNGARVIEATSISATGGRLDITNGRLIVDYVVGGSPIGSVREQIVSGYNVGGARWTGNGIVSSTAAGAGADLFGVGYAEASELPAVMAAGTFGSEPVDGSAVLVRYTKLGDADLDGSVGFSDLVRLAQNYNAAGGGLTWSRGDFTYDGLVNFSDLVKLAQNYNTALAAADALPAAGVAGAAFAEDWAAAMVQAPEPGAVGVVGIVSVVGLMRRRRRAKA
jgi:hypothetical protein